MEPKTWGREKGALLVAWALAVVSLLLYYGHPAGEAALQIALPACFVYSGGALLSKTSRINKEVEADAREAVNSDNGIRPAGHGYD